MGASSMGALRAAELSQFGMVGIGEVYQAFKLGRLEDDDEVAIVHGPEGSRLPAIDGSNGQHQSNSRGCLYR